MQTLQNFIGPTIRIGREIRCFPYVGFFYIEVGLDPTWPHCGLSQLRTLCYMWEDAMFSPHGQLHSDWPQHTKSIPIHEFPVLTSPSLSSLFCSHHVISSILTDPSTPSPFSSLISLFCSHHVISAILTDPITSSSAQLKTSGYNWEWLEMAGNWWKSFCIYYKFSHI